mmetsp:Transcript_35742/g.83681  ORF Transcript_35742/g.83681 Transcript_35742/m.83681 type:complete len:86 (+) Transcript_35742:80-337(+)
MFDVREMDLKSSEGATLATVSLVDCDEVCMRIDSDGLLDVACFAEKVQVPRHPTLSARPSWGGGVARQHESELKGLLEGLRPALS